MKQRTDENGETIYEFTIPPQEQINIPSGIRVNIIDKNTYLQATNKSGVASKFHLDVMANTIDADYQGEVHLNLVNTGNKPITIRTGQKIVQFIHKEYLDTVWSEISNEEYDMIETSDRSTGGFGSSGIQ
jgi:dUTP pyrophosphatase